MNSLQVSERVESFIATTGFKKWNRIVSAYIDDISQHSFSWCNTKSLMTNTKNTKRNTEKRYRVTSLIIFLSENKFRTKFRHGTNNIKTPSSFKHTLNRKILGKG